MKTLALLLCLFLFSPALFGQTATLRGVVTDVSGAIVPGAAVTVKGPAGLVRTATAGADGTYSFAGLPGGDYTVSATFPDLALPQPAKVTLTGGVQTVNLQMQVVATTQQVTVQENAGPTLSVNPENNASGLILRGDDLQALSDDPEDLQSDLQALAGPSAGPSGGSIYIDGFSGGELPPKDSIREIRINQNPFGPEWDRLGYGRIEIFTKPGTDKFHGSVYYNFGDTALNSRNPYAAEKAPFLLNEFGFDLSGPLSKRASFVIDARRDMVDNGSIINGVDLNSALVPTPFNGFLSTPQARTLIAPRIDYQLTTNNTLTVRYQVTDSGIQNANVGGFDTAPLGDHISLLNQTVQATETAVLNTSTINETRFQYFRSSVQTIANNPDPQIQVLGSFFAGGAQTGHSSDLSSSYELQNYTTITHSAHTWKFGVRLRGYTDYNVSEQNFGGTFIFGGVTGLGLNSIEQYRDVLMGVQGVLPTQFTITKGAPGLGVEQGDIGVFAGDDWRVRPNITLSLGLRYEAQTNIHDFGDVAPRVGFAWALGPKARSGQSKTVLRAGFGIFYDRFALSNILTARRFNGSDQQQYVVNNPDFFNCGTAPNPNDCVPVIPPFSMLGATQSTSVIERIDSSLHAPYLMQSAVTLERQLLKSTTLAATYTNSHGLHQLRSEDINAPLPGPFQQGMSVYPYGTPNPIFLEESSGLYNQNQLILNINSQLNSNVSLYGWYVLNHAMSNTDGINTFPANPYSMQGEYGPASSDVRNRVFVAGTINTKWNVRLSPFVIVQSGAPFNITIGRDIYGDTLLNARPGIPTTQAEMERSILTPYGLLDPDPQQGEELIPRNDGRSPGMVSVNLRLSKVFGFGSSREGASGVSPASRGGGRGGPGPGGGGMRNFFAPPTTSHRYNLSVSLAARNVINHTNPGPIIGNITSPLFGESNSLATGFGPPPGPGSFMETANNRRLELQVRFSF